MKILLLLTIVSCAAPVKRRSYHKPKTVIQKIAECTERYFSQHGVEPSKAFDICEKIYKGRNDE